MSTASQRNMALTDIAGTKPGSNSLNASGAPSTPVTVSHTHKLMDQPQPSTTGGKNARKPVARPALHNNRNSWTPGDDRYNLASSNHFNLARSNAIRRKTPTLSMSPEKGKLMKISEHVVEITERHVSPLSHQASVRSQCASLSSMSIDDVDVRYNLASSNHFNLARSNAIRRKTPILSMSPEKGRLVKISEHAVEITERHASPLSYQASVRSQCASLGSISIDDADVRYNLASSNHFNLARSNAIRRKKPILSMSPEKG